MADIADNKKMSTFAAVKKIRAASLAQLARARDL